MPKLSNCFQTPLNRSLTAPSAIIGVFLSFCATAAFAQSEVPAPPPLNKDFYPSYPTYQTQAQDQFIGVVSALRTEERAANRRDPGAGSFVGAVVGGLLGSQMGTKSDTRVLGAVVGAVGGGLIGHSIENSRRATLAYVATVRMNDGSTREFSFENRPPFQVGDRVDTRQLGASRTVSAAPVNVQPQSSYSHRRQRKPIQPETYGIRNDGMPSDNPYAG